MDYLNKKRSQEEIEEDEIERKHKIAEKDEIEYDKHQLQDLKEV